MMIVMQDVDRRIGAKLRERREQLQLSASEVAGTLGLTWEAVIIYEEGWKRVPSALLLRLAQLYHVMPGYFLADLDPDL